MTEEWRDIAGYEGLYKVSNRGEVMRMAQDIIGKYGLKISLANMATFITSQSIY